MSLYSEDVDLPILQSFLSNHDTQRVKWQHRLHQPTENKTAKPQMCIVGKKGFTFEALTTPNRNWTQAFTEIGCIGDSIRFGQKLRVLVMTYVHFYQVQIHAGSFEFCHTWGLTLRPPTWFNHNLTNLSQWWFCSLCCSKWFLCLSLGIKSSCLTTQRKAIEQL